MRVEYLTYSQYIAMGGEGDLAAFAQREFRARKIVDEWTAMRVSRMACVPEAVRRLMFDLIKFDEGTGGASAAPTGAIASMSNDGYSVTFAEPVTISVQQKTQGVLVSQYLTGETDDNGVPLLYRGRIYV